MSRGAAVQSGSGTDGWKRRVGELAQESPRAYLLALRVTGTPALAEEAVQEAYAKLLANPLKDEGYDQAVVYLFKAVRGTALNLARSSRNRKQREDAYAVRRDTTSSAPDAVSETAEVASAARSALAELPPEEREAVSLCYEQDLSHAMVSKILEVPERTVYNRVERGLEKLRSMLAAQGFASLTPLVIGEGLRELGVPPAPSGLMRAVTDLAGGAQKTVHAAKYTGGKAAAAKTGAGMKVVAGVVLASAIATAVVFSNQSQPSVPVATPVSTPLPPASPPKTASGPVALWKFDEGRGTALKDSSGNGNDGTLANGPEWTNGGLKFTVDGSHVDIPNSASLDIGGHELTIAIRENLTAKADGEQDHVMIGKAWTASKWDPPYWQYGMEYNNRTKTFDLLFGDKTEVFRGPYSFPATLGQRNHVAFTYDGVNVKGYLDGVEKISIPETRELVARGNGLRIGVDEILRQQCKGQLSEIRIYNRTLSAAEIATLAAQKKP